MGQPTPLTEAELLEVEARVAAATPGPWAWASDGFGDVRIGVTEPSVSGSCSDDLVVSDANFIAHARTDVPRLVATVKALQAQMEGMALYASFDTEDSKAADAIFAQYRQAGRNDRQAEVEALRARAEAAEAKLGNGSAPKREADARAGTAPVVPATHEAETAAGNAAGNKSRALANALRFLDQSLAPAPWRADIDGAGTPDEMWTGKFYAGTAEANNETTAGPIGATCEGPDRGATEGRALAELRSLVPALIDLLEERAR